MQVPTSSQLLHQILFIEGRTQFEDEARMGRLSDNITEENVAAVRTLLEGDRRSTLTELFLLMNEPLDYSRATIGRTVREVLNFRKISYRWVLRLLTEEQKINRAGAALEFLTLYKELGLGLIKRVVIGDETWIYHYTLETKRQSMIWTLPGKPALKKAKVEFSTHKVMATIFFDWQGILLVRYLPKGSRINADSYCDVVKDLRREIRRKHPGCF